MLILLFKFYLSSLLYPTHQHIPSCWCPFDGCAHSEQIQKLGGIVGSIREFNYNLINPLLWGEEPATTLYYAHGLDTLYVVKPDHLSSLPACKAWWPCGDLLNQWSEMSSVCLLISHTHRVWVFHRGSYRCVHSGWILGWHGWSLIWCFNVIQIIEKRPGHSRSRVFREVEMLYQCQGHRYGMLCVTLLICSKPQREIACNGHRNTKVHCDKNKSNMVAKGREILFNTPN